jgi:hypothetical protein
MARSLGLPICWWWAGRGSHSHVEVVPPVTSSVACDRWPVPTPDLDRSRSAEAGRTGGTPWRCGLGLAKSRWSSVRLDEAARLFHPQIPGPIGKPEKIRSAVFVPACRLEQKKGKAGSNCLPDHSPGHRSLPRRFVIKLCPSFSVMVARPSASRRQRGPRCHHRAELRIARRSLIVAQHVLMPAFHEALPLRPSSPGDDWPLIATDRSRLQLFH